MRIAVVGSGIAGLASAWLLSRRHDVTLFEAGHYFGGHTHTHDAEQLGRRYRIDSGFIVHNPNHYPLLTRMFDQLGVISQPTTMSFSVHNEASGLEYNAATLDTLFCQRRNLCSLRFIGMVRDLMRFYREAPVLLGNTRDGSRRNIAAHYDLGNDFFGLFLSPDLMYSSAMWMSPADTLEIASTRKLERICRKLDLKPTDRVIEIGTGWGGFALYSAQHFGCHVTTTTISREQHALASERVAAAGMSEHVDLLLEDYRDLRGQYDKLVSIEMVEAIGAPYIDTYFKQLGALLKPDGLALLQAITIEDHRYAQALTSVDFIKRHAFPGSFIPSINALLAAKTRSSDLALTRLEDFGHSYALTLKAWRERFMAHLPLVRAQGFDERFIRMWEFYLSYCEGGFRERSIGVAHLLLAKPGNRRTALLPELESVSGIPA